MDENEDIGRKSIVMMLTAYGDLRPAAGSDEAVEAIPVIDPVAERGSPDGIGSSDDKYEILGTVGSGGMGEVLLVHDRDLKRQVAMKVLREELAKDPQQKLGFVAEAQATSQLEHPGIPPVHDIGVTPAAQVAFYFDNEGVAQSLEPGMSFSGFLWVAPDASVSSSTVSIVQIVDQDGTVIGTTSKGGVSGIAVPLPAAAWMGLGMLGLLAGWRRRRNPR